MKRTAWLAALFGLALLVGLILYQGVNEVTATLSRASWVLLWLAPLHLVPLALDAQAWTVLLAPRFPDKRGIFPFLLWIATIREAVNRLIPTVSIGGELVGIRLSRLRFEDSVSVTATIVIEVMLTTAAQYVFAAAGVVLILANDPDLDQTWSIVTALVLSLPIPIAFAWVLKYGRVFERLHQFAIRLVGEASRFVVRMEGARLDHEIALLLAQHRRLFVAFLWQLAGFVAGSLETWFALRVLGHPVSPAAAIAVESLSQAIRNVVFFVPGGLGVQEVAVVLFARLVGVGSDVGLALALVKRMREVLVGVPALLSWQWAEAGPMRLLRNAAQKLPLRAHTAVGSLGGDSEGGL